MRLLADGDDGWSLNILPTFFTQLTKSYRNHIPLNKIITPHDLLFVDLVCFLVK